MKAPFINLNGNSKKDIETQIKNINSSLSDAINIIIKSDYSNARNATDSAHAEKLKEEKAEVLKYLQETKKKYIAMFKAIQ